MNKSYFKNIISESAYGENLEQAISIISTEGILVDVKNFLGKHLPSLVDIFDGIKNTVANMLDSTPENLKMFDKQTRELLKKLKTLSYLEAKEILVPIPENFKGEYLEYLKEFESILKTSFNSCLINLNEYRSFISLFMSTTDYKTNLQDFTPKYRSLEAYRNSCLKSLNKYFPKETNSTRTMLKNVVYRLSDFEEIFKHAFNLSNIAASFNISKFKESVDDCYEMLKIMNRDIGKENSNITMQALRNLSIGTYEMAKYVEFISTLYFDAGTAYRSAYNMAEILTTDI